MLHLFANAMIHYHLHKMTNSANIRWSLNMRVTVTAILLLFSVIEYFNGDGSEKQTGNIPKSFTF